MNQNATDKPWAGFGRGGRKQFDKATRHLLPGEHVIDAWEGMIGEKLSDMVTGVLVATNKRIITTGSSLGLKKKGSQMMLTELVSADTGQDMLGGITAMAPSVTASSRAGQTIRFTPQVRRGDMARTDSGYIAARLMEIRSQAV